MRETPILDTEFDVGTSDTLPPPPPEEIPSGIVESVIHKIITATYEDRVEEIDAPFQYVNRD